jgi:hypothetical protein
VPADPTATRLLRLRRFFYIAVALIRNQEYHRMSRPWFGRKKFGFGVSPISWEGWVCVLLVIVIFTGFVLVFLKK